MSSFVIEFENVSKRYAIGPANPYRGLHALLENMARAPLGWASSKGEKPNKGQENSASRKASNIWALREVSFKVKDGEVLGIIGPNGAGKSVLLKILARVTKPTEGCVKLRGRVGSMLEVGTGFQPELTGRENIFVNGAILGMTRSEIRRKFDEIVSFSGVERFLDTPVKHYSSGMLMRLAFSVAVQLEPEILLIDEVLSVGDGAFRDKSQRKLVELSRDGRTILFVTHDMETLETLCNRTLVLNRGRMIKDARTEKAIEIYRSIDDSDV
jgi:lipopolysaccharide transport system ATP-binding protein